MFEALRITDSYRGDVDVQRHSELGAELVVAREERDNTLNRVKILEVKVDELTSASKKRLEAQKSTEKDNRELKKQVEDLKKHASSAEQALNVERCKLQTLEAERDRLLVENQDLSKEIDKLAGENKNLSLKLDESGVEIVNALESGYGKCLSRLEGAGFDVTGHSFDDFCVDLAEKEPDAWKGDAKKSPTKTGNAPEQL